MRLPVVAVGATPPSSLPRTEALSPQMLGVLAVDSLSRNFSQLRRVPFPKVTAPSLHCPRSHPMTVPCHQADTFPLPQCRTTLLSHPMELAEARPVTAAVPLLPFPGPASLFLPRYRSCEHSPVKPLHTSLHALGRTGSKALPGALTRQTGITQGGGYRRKPSPNRIMATEVNDKEPSEAMTLRMFIKGEESRGEK